MHFCLISLELLGKEWDWIDYWDKRGYVRIKYKINLKVVVKRFEEGVKKLNASKMIGISSEIKKKKSVAGVKYWKF